MRASGLSLWLIPNGEAYDQLAEAIRRIAERHGTPWFEPHVTLIGRLTGEEPEIWAAAAVLARHLRPYEIELGGLSTSDQYFRAVVADVTPSAPVMDANLAAREAFGRHDDPPYRPHLSLAYGQLSEQLAAAAAAEYERVTARRFMVSSLHLISTEGEAAAWQRIEEFPFGR